MLPQAASVLWHSPYVAARLIVDLLYVTTTGVLVVYGILDVYEWW
jgi:hypothetical protein